MIDLTTVDWRNDWITRRYVKENEAKLSNPRKMTPAELGDATTYCKTLYDPYAEELMRRAGNLEAFRCATTDSERMKILNNAAKSFGFRFG